MSDDTTKTVPIDQHYVPRSYLKNFGKIHYKGTKEKVNISFYQFKGELLRENIPTKTICYEHYFYGEDGALEEELANQERTWASVFRSVISMEDYALDENQENTIKKFAAYQFTRTLAQLNFSKATTKEILTACITEGADMEIDDAAKKAIQDKVDGSVAPSLLINVCKDAVSTLDDLGISIIKFETDTKLITSDAPVIVTNPFTPRKAGFANIGIFIMFPVSPDTLLAIYDTKVYHKCRPYMKVTCESDAINLNKYQIISAEERIISSEKSELLNAISNTDALELRKAITANDKVNIGRDIKGILLAAKSRNMPYTYDLSFCTLPKELRKIPIDCREAHSREYTRDGWLHSLVVLYRMPEYLKKDFGLTDAEFKERRDGYARMRSFLENYWEMPLAERAITPELMQKVKTLPFNKFSL